MQESDGSNNSGGFTYDEVALTSRKLKQMMKKKTSINTPLGARFQIQKGK